MNDLERTKMQQLYVPERMRWIDHRGIRILVHDYSGLSPEKLLEALMENSSVAAGLGRTDLKLLIIVTDVFANKKLVKIWKERAKKNRDLYEKVAVIGISGIMATFMRAINRFSGVNAVPFDDIEAAKDWLVSGDEAPTI